MKIKIVLWMTDIDKVWRKAAVKFVEIEVGRMRRTMNGARKKSSSWRSSWGKGAGTRKKETGQTRREDGIKYFFGRYFVRNFVRERLTKEN